MRRVLLAHKGAEHTRLAACANRAPIWRGTTTIPCVRAQCPGWQEPPGSCGPELAAPAAASQQRSSSLPRTAAQVCLYPPGLFSSDSRLNIVLRQQPFQAASPTLLRGRSAACLHSWAATRLSRHICRLSAQLRCAA